ncbi:MAG: GNAT family N-acetyltransferase [Acidobacteriota bacterium]|nr:GNAT family N-acetyltransferase [Acidobacteriota bacterium]
MKEKILKGKRVFLRQPTDKDFGELVLLYKSSRKFHRGLVQTPITKKAFEKYLAHSRQETNKYFLICRNKDGAIVGSVNLSQIFQGNFKNAYLGYYLGEKFTRQGIMTEAAEILLRFAFKGLKLHRVEANVQPENLPSIKVLQRNGFTKEGFSRRYLKIGGRWRDHERWAIIIEDWKKHHNTKDERSS